MALFTIDKWLGMYTTHESHRIPDFYLSNSKNLDQSSTGAIAPAKQYTILGNRVTGDGRILSLFNYVKIDATEIVLRVRDDDTYTYLEWYNATAEKWEQLIGSLTTGKIMAFASLNQSSLTPVAATDNRVYFCNGVMNLSYWNGAIGTVASNSATVITLNETAATAGFATGGGTVVVNGSEYTYTGISGYTLTGLTGLPTFDANEGVAEKADTTTLSAAPKFNKMTVAENRIWGNSDGSVRVYASKINDGTDWTTSTTPSDAQLIDVAGGTGPITALSSIREYVVMFKKDFILSYKLQYASDLTTVTSSTETIKQGSNAGCAGPQALDKDGDVIYYATEKGGIKSIFLNSTNDRLGSQDITDRIRPTLADGVFSGGALRYFDNKKTFICSFKKDSDSTQNDTCVVVQRVEEEGKLVHNNIGIYDWTANCFTEYKNDLLMGLSFEPNVFTCFDGVTRDGEYPFTAIATLKRYNFGTDKDQKKVDYIMVQGFIAPGNIINFEAEYDAGGSRAFLTAKFDSNNENDKTFIVEPARNLLGSFEYGSEPLGGTLEDVSDMSYFKFFFEMPVSHKPFEVMLNIYGDGGDSNNDVVGNNWKIEKIGFIVENSGYAIDANLKKPFIIK